MAPPNPSPIIRLPLVLQPSRRELLKTGLLGSALLASLHLAGGTAKAASGDYGFLTPEDATILGAIVPVVLDGALPEAVDDRTTALAEVMAGIDQTVQRMTPAVQEEIRQLFDLLGLAPVRILILGLWDRWEEAEPAAVDQALVDLRTSRFAMKRSIYNVLHDLPLAAWYGNPRSWAQIGYDGPPAIRRS